MKPSRPILRYHGGKWMLAPWIISFFPAHKVYCEPYGGAASVLLRKERSFAEIYNDLDEEIVELFKCARENGPELCARLAATPFSRVEFNQAYHKSECQIERSRKTIIRSFMGFGSDGVHSRHRTGFRSSSNRSGTTPAHDWANFPSCFNAIIERLRGVVIEHKPALEVIAKYDRSDALFYIDPPYVHSTRKRVDKARGYRHELTDSDHSALAAVLQKIKGRAIVSGYSSPLYNQLFQYWRREEKSGPFCDGAQKRTEVLWLNF